MRTELTQSYRFIIADDHPLFRRGLSNFLRARFEDCLVDHVDNGKELLAACGKNDYDIVFLDMRMPQMSGHETAQALLKLKPETKIIVLTMYDDQAHTIEMLQLGIKGYLVKDCAEEDLIAAVESVLQGAYYLANRNMDELLWKAIHADNTNANNTLSHREIEVLQLICKEYSNREIAKRLFISVRTVENHRHHIHAKTHTHNAAGLVKYAASKGWV